MSCAVSFDGHSWAVSPGDGSWSALSCEDGMLLPQLEEAVDCLFWPVERLLLRPFRLPLNHPRLLDAEIVGQEMAEQAGEDPESWWLSWQATVDGEGKGIAGVLFGLPSGVCEAIDADEAWRHTPGIVVDAAARLGVWLPAEGDGQPLALFDMDADGLFFGVRQGDVWLGIRRLNGTRERWDDMAQDAVRSLAAMGWNRAEHGATGRLAPELVSALAIEQWYGSTCEEGKLPGRHEANMALAAALPAQSVNLRHGRWAVRRRSVETKSWRRPMVLAAILLLVWVLGTSIQIYRLSGQAAGYSRQIADAFHRGLPHETVMMDALAQLRKAAGGASGEVAGSGELLRQLQAVGGVYRKSPWTLRELEFDHGGMHMSGKVDGLGKLNAIRKALAGKLGRDVELADTDLQGDSVSFRMNW